MKIFSTATETNQNLTKKDEKVTIFSTNQAPHVLGHYSKSTLAWNLVFCSWQIALDPGSDELVPWWIEEQTRQACRNIRAVLSEHKLWLKDVIKTTIYVSNMKYVEKINDLYKDYFVLKPARTLVEVSSLPKWALIEIEAIAMIR